MHEDVGFDHILTKETYFCHSSPVYVYAIIHKVKRKTNLSIHFSFYSNNSFYDDNPFRMVILMSLGHSIS